MRDPGLPWAISDLVCDHGHVEVAPWTGCEGGECWYGHPITGGAVTCAAARRYGLEVWWES